MRNPTVDGVCYKGDLELFKDPVPQMKVADVLKHTRMTYL